jgi:hypothetical protein
VGRFGFVLLILGFGTAGLCWFITEVARRDVFTNPKATAEQLRDAERSRRELQQFGPAWTRISLIVGGVGAGLLTLHVLLR